jgi:hypothetical protein
MVRNPSCRKEQAPLSRGRRNEQLQTSGQRFQACHAASAKLQTRVKTQECADVVLLSLIACADKACAEQS